MPTVSMFFGIRIIFRYNEHVPPHFHAEYAGKSATIDIQNCKVLKSGLPKRQLKLILAWCELHKDELMQNWALAQVGKNVLPIEPLR